MTQRPNLLLIMCDQLRADALGTDAGGAGYVRTPAIDRIAREGTRFDRCYTNSPVCVPTRLSLATGLYPHNTGMWSNVALRNGKRLPGKGSQDHCLDPDWPTWMAAVRDAGYATALVGKTHLHPHRGDLRDREHLMHAYGLDHVDEIGGPRASTRVGSHMTDLWQRKGLWQKYQDDYNERFSQALPVARPGVIPLEDYADTYVGQQSKRWLEQYGGNRPWMLWASFGGPHEPWDTPEPYASMYDPADMPEPLPAPGWLDTIPPDSDTADYFRSQHRAYEKQGGLTRPLARALTANYAGNMTLIDDQITDLLAAVEVRGEMDHTVIVLVSDHGEMNGDRGVVHKNNFLEQSARVPLIIRTPETAQRGRAVSAQPVELIDLGAAFCDWADADWTAHHFARSLAPLVDEPAQRLREVAIVEHAGEAMVCDGRYKAIYASTGEPYMLFDLHDDPLESANILSNTSLAATLNQLSAHLRRHLMSTQLQEPGPRGHWEQIKATHPG